MLVESQPKLFYFTDHYRDYPMVLIRLSRAKRAAVEPLLRRHWRTLASRKAIASMRNCRLVSVIASASEAYPCRNRASMDCFVATLLAMTIPC